MKGNPLERSAGIIGLFLLLVNESFFLFRAWIGDLRDHIKQSRQEESDEENDKKQFRFAIYEKEDTQSKNDYDNRMVLSKGNNPVHECRKIHKASLLKPLYHIFSNRAGLKKVMLKSNGEFAQAAES
jgi:hypothetical protein